ncbi:uncharacterized protein DS421_17g583820 [Arachis hypogaea]|nr:uncharacterized protein DS421_17g583820 [Arachis hypogaea]
MATPDVYISPGECTITLEDVAMQLGLPIDGKPINVGHVGTTKYNIKLKWHKTRLQQMPLNLPDDVLIQYARCYILYLLGDMLLPDKANNTVHVRYLPLLADFDAISTYSRGSACLCWLYRAMCLAKDYTVEGMAGCHTWAGKKGHNDYAEQRLLRHRLSLIGCRTWILVFCPDCLLNFLAILMEPSTPRFQDYYRWYCDRIRRFLSTPDALHDPRTDDIPAGVPAEYERALVVRLPDVPQDRRHRQTRRERHHGAAGVGFKKAEFPTQDRPQNEPEVGAHGQQVQPQLHGDFYYPQPFMTRDQPQPPSMHQVIPYHSSYEVGGSSQSGVCTISSLSSRHPPPPTDLGIALPRSDTDSQPVIKGRRSTSIADIAVSSLRPYDVSFKQG